LLIRAVKPRAFGAPERLLGLDCSAWSSKLLTENAGPKIECTFGG
jgi:hypothetical protein